MPQRQKQPTKENALLSYANRIQHHLTILTETRMNITLITKHEKTILKQIILNLPPNAKEHLKTITEKLDNPKPLSCTGFDELYSTVHNWIYINILQVAFGATPLNEEVVKIGGP